MCNTTTRGGCQTAPCCACPSPSVGEICAAVNACARPNYTTFNPTWCAIQRAAKEAMCAAYNAAAAANDAARLAQESQQAAREIACLAERAIEEAENSCRPCCHHDCDCDCHHDCDCDD